MLAIIYWILLVLAVLGIFAPPDWKHAPRINSLVWIVLFVIIGLKIMKVAL